MHTQSTLNVPLLIELLNEPYEMQVLERLLEQNPGGITKLPVGLAYFEFEFEGERLIFGNEMRQRIETALGATLQERAYPNYRLEIALDIPEPQRSAAIGFISAWKATQDGAAV